MNKQIEIVSWKAAVVQMVKDQKRANSFQSLTIRQVYDRVLLLVPDLTLGMFHDGMRGLHKSRQVRLAPYTQALATLPCPLTALYLDNEVKFFVQTGTV